MIIVVIIMIIIVVIADQWSKKGRVPGKTSQYLRASLQFRPRFSPRFPPECYGEHNPAACMSTAGENPKNIAAIGKIRQINPRIVPL